MTKNRITHHTEYWTEEYCERGVQIRQLDGTMQWFPTVITRSGALALRPEHWWQDPAFWRGAQRGYLIAHVGVAAGLLIAVVLSYVQWLFA